MTTPPCPPATAAAFVVQHHWRVRASHQLQATRATLRELCVCAVCRDECVRVVRCPNGHATCVGCTLSASDTRCPVCRDSRALNLDSMVATALEACGARLKCATCGQHSAVAHHERHRAWCAAHRFVCPWATCMQCVAARDMSTHVLGHGNVPRLVRQLDGTYHLLLATTPRTNDAWLVCVGNATVVLTNATPRRLVAAEHNLVHIGARCYYAGPDASVVRLVMRQLLVSQCADRDHYTEEHRIGVVPPMIASREAIVANGVPSILATRALLADGETSATDLATTFAIPDVRPGTTPGLVERAKRVGLRDLPPASPPLTQLPDGLTPACLLHFCFRVDPTTTIGSLFDA